jgi:hypothetical protein
MNFCPFCGARLSGNKDETKCIYCGAALNSEDNKPNQNSQDNGGAANPPPVFVSHNSYGQSSGSGYNQGYNNQGYNQGNNNQGYGQGNFQNNPNQGFNNPPGASVLDNTWHIIFSIINILCCCLNPLAIVALVMAATARREYSYESGKNKLKTSLILNIVGIAIGIIIWIIFVIIGNNLDFADIYY